MRQQGVNTEKEGLGSATGSAQACNFIKKRL